MDSLRRSATLEPPRKSIELEDPGAHELGKERIYLIFPPKHSDGYADVRSPEASETEEDVFSDAQEGHGSNSDANSPIPITRVERVLFISI